METILFWGATKGRGSGIGKNVADYLALSDLTVFGERKLIFAGRNKEKLETLSQELAPYCRQVPPSIFVSEYPINEIEYAKVLEENDVTTVISFIGTGFGESLLFIEDSSVEEMLKANFLVNLDIVKKSIPFLKNKDANIILANSIVGMIPTEGSSVYTATKFALRGFIESLREEIKPYKIGFSCLYFQNVHKIGLAPIFDAVEMAVKNRRVNLDFIIS